VGERGALGNGETGAQWGAEGSIPFYTGGGRVRYIFVREDGQVWKRDRRVDALARRTSGRYNLCFS
jgi:hypothetical protein